MMKILMPLFLLVLGGIEVSAQTPQAIPYQAVARNAAGVPLSNQNIKVRFSIRDSLLSGTIVYRETHTTTTNSLGLFNLNVGMGSPVTGTFSGINWGENSKFLQVEMDPAGGNSFTDLGTQQMMSVPYALNAGSIKMKVSSIGDSLFTGGGNFVIIPGVSAANSNSVTDIDGNVYQTVTIGNQVWMKENLKVQKFRNGDLIPNISDSIQWINLNSSAWCYYGNNSALNPGYGKLYNFYVVQDSRGVCPVGWHVPTSSQWTQLEIHLGLIDPQPIIRGINENVGGKLKSVTGWESPNTGATNQSGFSAVGGGYRNDFGSFDILLGKYGLFWTSTFDEGPFCRGLGYDYNGVFNANAANNFGFSIRCLKD
jgi:uncharacterized protein (TIGR02145 family)